jgi:hypothetical protein
MGKTAGEATDRNKCTLQSRELFFVVSLDHRLVLREELRTRRYEFDSESAKWWITFGSTMRT